MNIRKQSTRIHPDWTAAAPLLGERAGVRGTISSNSPRFMESVSCSTGSLRLRLNPFLLLVLFFSTGCRNAGAHSPTIDVLGSYFPAWMACIIIWLILTIISRQVLIGLRLNSYLRPAGLVYLCMTVLWTLTVWLICYKN